MSLVEFTLDPIDQIQPWGSEGALSLSWFGFSSGRYRLKFGEHYLLNYSADAVARMAERYPNVYPGPWVDYQVVRLWEDLIRLVPCVLPPVPEELAPLMRLDEALWRRWMAVAVELSETGAVSEDAVELLEQWRGDRVLDTGYLSPSARIWFWQADGVVEVRWCNADKFIEGVPAWSATRDAYRLPTTEFLSGVQSFNDAFLIAMNERVECILKGGYRSDVHVDLDHLASEQVDRSGWLANELAKNIEEDSGAVIAAARALIAVAPIPE